MSSQAASQQNVLQAFFNTALSEMMAVAKAECGSILLFDPEHKELVLDSFHNAPTLSRGQRQKVGEGVAGKVISMSTPVLVKNIDSDSRFQRNGFNHYHTPSFLSIPLSGDQGTLGIINLTDKTTGEAFDEKDFESAVAMARTVYHIAHNMIHITRLRQENARLQQQLTVNEKYTSIGKLTAELLHQINSPLDGTMRYTNMLLAQEGLDDISRSYLSNVKKGLDRIVSITKSVLEFSRMCATSQMVETRRVQVNRLIEDALDTLKHRIPSTVSVSTSLSPDVAPVPDFGIQHALMNLLTNALDAMPLGGELEVSTCMNEGETVVTVRDTGTGIAHRLHEKIFEPFFTTKEPGKGTGLGLSISREVIEKYGGRIIVESSPGRGSTFTMHIPV